MIKSTVQDKGLETLQVPTALKQKHVSPSIPFSVTTNVTNCHCFTKQLKNNLEEGTKIINLILSISQYFFFFVMVSHCILLHGQNALKISFLILRLLMRSWGKAIAYPKAKWFNMQSSSQRHLPAILRLCYSMQQELKSRNINSMWTFQKAWPWSKKQHVSSFRKQFHLYALSFLFKEGWG